MALKPDSQHNNYSSV